MDNTMLFVVQILLTSSCLAENIVLDKPAYQIGHYGGATADKAVDGRYDKDTGDEYYLSVCAHPDTSWYGNGPAKWWVDLQATYSISKVTVWNTYNTESYWMMNNFTVEVISSDNKTTQSCGDYRQVEPVSRGGSYTFNCNNEQGSYVYVRRLEGSELQQWLILCEVEVDGYPVKRSTSPEAKTLGQTSTRAEGLTNTRTLTTSSVSTSTYRISRAKLTPESTTLSAMTGRSSGNDVAAKPDTCNITLPWALFGLSSVVNLIFVTLHFLAPE